MSTEGMETQPSPPSSRLAFNFYVSEKDVNRAAGGSLKLHLYQVSRALACRRCWLFEMALVLPVLPGTVSLSSHALPSKASHVCPTGPSH